MLDPECPDVCLLCENWTDLIYEKTQQGVPTSLCRRRQGRNIHKGAVKQGLCIFAACLVKENRLSWVHPPQSP